MSQLIPKGEKETVRAVTTTLCDRLNFNLLDLSKTATNCQAGLLPFLAYEVGVDIAGLSELEARKTIGQAVNIHRHKGTAYAVRVALETVFEHGVIKEFLSAQPFYFEAEVALGGDPTVIFTKDKMERVIQLIEMAKNVRSHFNITSTAVMKQDNHYQNGIVWQI